MEIELDYQKSVDQNASDYFQKAKKLRQKNKKILEVLEKTKIKLDQLEKLDEKSKLEQIEKEKVTKHKKSHWYDKFRIFITSNLNIVLMGMDQVTNDILIKKHTGDNDKVYHTELAGSGYAVLSKNNFDINSEDFLEHESLNLEEKQVDFEICQFVATFSKASKSGLVNPAVFSFERSQMLSSSPEGISLPRGSFYIKGKKTYYNYENEIYGIGLFKSYPLWAPLTVLENLGVDYVVLKQGKLKPTAVAKLISKGFDKITNKKNHLDIDEIVKYIPKKGMEIDNYYLKRLENRKLKKNV